MDSLNAASKGIRKTSPPSAPVYQEFLFVDASKSAKSSHQGRRNARSFVMQKARRERPWSTSKHASKQRRAPETTSPVALATPDFSSSSSSITPTPSPPLVTGAEYFHFDPNYLTMAKYEICSDCRTIQCYPHQAYCIRCLRLRMAPVEDVDNGLFDPFGTVSIEINDRSSELLDHFVSQMVPFTIAIDFRRKSNLMRSDWFGTAMSNACFMHSLLCSSALHLYYSGRCSMETILYHKAEAIAAVNSALNDPDPRVRTSDATIGAVFNLLCVEESLPSAYLKQEADEETLNERQYHLNGLRKMVQLRGGLMAITSNRILQAFILWHSTAHAIASFEAPYLSTIDYISISCLPPRPPGYQPSISRHLIHYCHQANIKESLTELVESALKLIADLNVWFHVPNNPLDPLDIQNYSCILECLLLSWLRENANFTSPLEDALCVAMLTFTVRVTEALQSRPGNHPLHLVASKRLQKALTATSRYEWTRCPDLLLWILSIGAISAEGSPDYAWFVYQVSLACEEFGILSSEDLLGRLHLCGWVSFKLDGAVYSLWDRTLSLSDEPPVEELNSVGPLQAQVSEPNYADWQNVDWTTLNNETQMPRDFGEPSMGRGGEGLHDGDTLHTPAKAFTNYMGLAGATFSGLMRNSE